MRQMLSLPEALTKKLLFVHGKGGVGKSLFSKALAEILLERSGSHPEVEGSILLVQIDDPREERVDVVRHPNGISTLNATVKESFLEYAGMKLNSPALARFLLDHRLVNYLVEAAPGMKELAIVGKIWHETRNFSTVIVDMPSTGHALTLFQAFRNWAELFENSPIARDSKKIEADFSNPKFCSHLLLALPEEMPITESRELRVALEKFFPKFESAFFMNRVTPAPGPGHLVMEKVKTSTRPYSFSADEHFQRRRELEAFHLNSVRDLEPKTIPNFIPDGNLVPLIKATLQSYLNGDIS